MTREIFKDLEPVILCDDPGPVYRALVNIGLPCGRVTAAVGLLLKFYDDHQPTYKWAIKGWEPWWLADPTICYDQRWTTCKSYRQLFDTRDEAVRVLRAGRASGFIKGASLIRIKQRSK